MHAGGFAAVLPAVLYPDFSPEGHQRRRCGRVLLAVLYSPFSPYSVADFARFKEDRRAFWPVAAGQQAGQLVRCRPRVRVFGSSRQVFSAAEHIWGRSTGTE